MKKNIFILLSGQYSSIFISGITGIFISRYLGVLQTGKLGILQTLFALLGIFAGLGQVSAGNALMLRSKKNHWKLINKVSTLIFTISCSIFCLLIFIFFQNIIDQKLIYICLSFSLITGGLDIYSDRWELEHKSNKVAKLKIYNGFILGILRIIGASLSLDLYYFCLIPGITRLLSFNLVSIKDNLPKYNRLFNKKFFNFTLNFKEIGFGKYFNLGFITGIESLLFNAANRLDILMLDNLASNPLKEIGIYVGANKFFIVVIPLATTIATSVAGKLHKDNRNDYKLKTIKFFEKKFPKYLLLSTLITILLFIASPFFENLLGLEFKGVKDVSMSLSLGYLPLSISIWSNKQLKI